MTATVIIISLSMIAASIVTRNFIVIFVSVIYFGFLIWKYYRVPGEIIEDMSDVKKRIVTLFSIGLGTSFMALSIEPIKEFIVSLGGVWSNIIFLVLGIFLMLLGTYVVKKL